MIADQHWAKLRPSALRCELRCRREISLLCNFTTFQRVKQWSARKGNVILIFLRSSNNHADLRSDLFTLNMFHLITYFAAVMLIQGLFMCETSFSLISPLPVNLVTTFHQYRHDLCSLFSCCDQRANGSTEWVAIRQLVLKLFLLSWVESDFDETLYKCYENKGCKVTEHTWNICIYCTE